MREEEISIDKDDYTINGRIFIVTSLIRDIPSSAFLPLTAALDRQRVVAISTTSGLGLTIDRH